MTDCPCDSNSTLMAYPSHKSLDHPHRNGFAVCASCGFCWGVKA